MPRLSQHDPSQATEAARWAYFHADASNSRALTDGAAAVTRRWEYDPFGVVRTTSGAASSDFQYGGEQKDPETGLINLRARYYDPALGRFLSRDPLPGKDGFPQSYNRYQYGLNNPLRYVDPSGYEDEPWTQEDWDNYFRWQKEWEDSKQDVKDRMRRRNSQEERDRQAQQRELERIEAAYWREWNARQAALQASQPAEPEPLAAIIDGATQLPYAGNTTPTHTTAEQPEAAVYVSAMSNGPTCNSLPPGGWRTACKAVEIADKVVDVVQNLPPIELEDPPAYDSEGLPILYIDTKKVPGIARNIATAQTSPDDPAPAVLTRTTDIRRIRANRRQACGIGARPPLSCDEYPFATTYEGGKAAYTAIVSIAEQASQGGTLSRFYDRHRLKDGDQFRVTVINMDD